jgi:hypothetical protein
MPVEARMYSTTVAGAVVPVWDRALLAAVTTHSTPGGDTSRLRIGVLNPEGQLYREIFSGNLAEHAELLERMAMLGFDVLPGRGGLSMGWRLATSASRAWPREERRSRDGPSRAARA